MKLIFTLLTVCVFASTAVFAQCSKANKIIKNHKKEGWAESTQSKSGILQAGKDYEMTFVAQKDMEYLLSFGTNVEEVSQQIDYVIYEKVVIKVEENGKKVYRKVDNILYDSKEHDFALETTFVNRKSRKLYIKVSVPVKENKKENHCVGILIEQQRAQQLGLN